ncbi:M23 family metallopeptidase [Ferrovibrio sp.]|uniref:M23 family metallopeptidase n=1 Tax=Ferrovibrio sp. TaxID=1917215 RepID=UPI00311EBE2C
MKHLFAALVALLGIAPALANEPPAGMSWRGDFIQGGMITGSVVPGTVLRLGDRPVPVGPNGEYVFGFGRDEAADMPLQVRQPDGQQVLVRLQIARRDYDIQRIDGLPPAQVTPPAAVLERIRRENEKIAEVRRQNSPRTDFLQGWIWPADGPVSGVYGSQRILNGEPRQPHFGVDIAAPAGSPVVASAAGIVVMAEKDLYYTGGTVILDHGMGITAAYSHLREVGVTVGQQVKQGEAIGTVGATGRATGPHLDWRVNWFDVRLDPLLLLPARKP